MIGLYAKSDYHHETGNWSEVLNGDLERVFGKDHDTFSIYRSINPLIDTYFINILFDSGVKTRIYTLALERIAL